MCQKYCSEVATTITTNIASLLEDKDKMHGTAPNDAALTILHHLHGNCTFATLPYCTVVLEKYCTICFRCFAALHDSTVCIPVPVARPGTARRK